MAIQTVAKENNMYRIPRIITSIFVGYVACSNAEVTQRQINESHDTAVMKQLKHSVSEGKKAPLPKPAANQGPLTYRLSTIRGLAFETTNTTIILTSRDKIIGGINAKFNEFPWQVALLNSNYGTLFCGGTHIGKGWILTAAHCFKDEFGQIRKSNVSVLVGTNSLVNGGTRTALIGEPIVHENYDSISKANDIALIRIPEAIQLASARIPAIPVEKPLIASKSVLTVTGWGTVTENGAISTELLKVDVPVMDQDICKAAYPNQISSTQVCAGSMSKDSCQGDSGGPLIGRDNEGFVLVGIVSFGKGCGLDGFPGVYTRAVAFRDWIQAKAGI